MKTIKVSEAKDVALDYLLRQVRNQFDPTWLEEQQ